MTLATLLKPAVTDSTIVRFGRRFGTLVPTRLQLAAIKADAITEVTSGVACTAQLDYAWL